MIRQASLVDVPILVELAQLMHAESPVYSRIPFKAADLAAEMSAWIAHPGWFKVVAGDGITRPLVGFMFAAVVPYFFNKEQNFACDRMLYIHPDRRGGTSGIGMIRRYEAWAQRQGVKKDDILLGNTTGIRMGRSGQLYEALGYECIGHAYAKRGDK